MRTLPKAFWIAVTAVAYSGFLLVLAATVPVYGTSDSGSGEGTATLIAVNGAGIALVPLFAAITVFGLLHAVCSTGSAVALNLAWTGTALVWVFAVLGLMTIGIAILPLGALLAWACDATPRGRSAVC